MNYITPFPVDPAFIQLLAYAPFLSEAIRRQHHTFVANDSRFAASARLLAHLWRQDQQLPPASASRTATLRSPRRSPANWLLHRDAAQTGATFLTPAIRDHALQALLFREPGALWNEDRLWANLLSSQALTLNLLAPLATDLALASRVWRRLLPGFIQDVTALRFEHSPGRFDDAYFGDGTALDALIEGVTPDGEAAVVTVELKFVEGLSGPAATPRARYVEAAQASGLYRDAAGAILARPGFEQLRREHVLTDLMLRHGLASRACFVLIAPQLNRRAQAVATRYRAELVDPAGAGDAAVSFVNLTLEAVIAATAQASAPDSAHQLWARYCDHARVARLALQGDEPPPAAGPLCALPPPLLPAADTTTAAKPSKVSAASTRRTRSPSPASSPAPTPGPTSAPRSRKPARPTKTKPATSAPVSAVAGSAR
jgi:hypothetical protein